MLLACAVNLRQEKHILMLSPIMHDTAENNRPSLLFIPSHQTILLFYQHLYSVQTLYCFV